MEKSVFRDNINFYLVSFNLYCQVEEDPHNFFAFALIGDFLFGTTPEQVTVIHIFNIC